MSEKSTIGFPFSSTANSKLSTSSSTWFLLLLIPLPPIPLPLTTTPGLAKNYYLNRFTLRKCVMRSPNQWTLKKTYFFSCLSRTRFRRLPRFFPASRRNFSLSQLSPCWHWNPDWPTSTGHTFNCLGQCLHLADLKVESEKIEIKPCMRNRCSKWAPLQICEACLSGLWH